MSRLYIVCLLHVVLGSGAFCSAASIAQEPSSEQSDSKRGGEVDIDRGQLERRLESVRTLVERSSGARQIETTGDARAIEKRGRARELHRQAQDAFKSNDLRKASRLLTEASVTMFEAVRLSAPEKVTAEKSQTDFNSRMESVKALLAAQKRVASEKAGVAGSAEAARTVESLIGEATQQNVAGKTAEAKQTIDRAYLVAKASIASMRGGDTLVRSLNFKSKEEEYHYEIDRNDTHQMLIKVLLAEKRDQLEMDRMVRGFLEKAGQLRGHAEIAASRGDFAGGIKLLEESTGELVKAIRNAGIYIPG